MATYFVDSATGVDTNAGTVGSPWLTIQRASNGNGVGSPVVAGDKVNIKAGTNYDINTTAVSFTNSGTATGPIVYRGYTTTEDDDAGRPIITSNDTSLNLFNISGRSGLCFQHLKFTHTGSTKGNGIAASSADASNLTLVDCHFDGCLNAVWAAYSTQFKIDGLTAERCVVISAAENGFYIAGVTHIINCLIKGCTLYGVYKTAGVIGGTFIYNSVIKTCSRGLYLNNGSIGSPVFVRNCAFHSHTNEAIYKQDSFLYDFGIANTVFHSNSYAVRMASAVTRCFNHNNAYGTATNGNVNWPAGTGDQTITGDPWTNASSDDYSPDATTDQGADLRNTGFPGVAPFGTGYADIGPLRHQDPAGGGAGIAVLTGGGLAR